jgi:hypothetical protein
MLGADGSDQLRSRSLGELLWRKSLGGTGNDHSVQNGSLEQPVLISIASDSGVNASLAEVEVTALTDTAMIMFIWNGRAAVIAVNGV